MRSLNIVVLSYLILLACISDAMPRVRESAQFFHPASQTLSGWQSYTVKGEEFSVSLPAIPAMTTESTLIRTGKTRIQRVIGSYSSGVAYAILTFENLPQQTLNDFTEEMRKRQSRIRVWSNASDISVNGFSGQQFDVVEREVKGVVQFFRTKDHLYKFEAMGAPIGDPRVQQFLSSIALGKKVEGTKLENGSGAEIPDQDPSVQIFRHSDVDRKLVVVTKPEPSYTETARQANTKGVVVLRAVFASTGRLENIEVVSGLPNGLSNQAIAAARQVRFVPAMKNGQFVSVELQVEYHFNLY